MSWRFLVERDLVERGVPAILTYEFGLSDEGYGHASVVAGYDDRRQVVLLRDPSSWNWLGFRSYDDVHGLQAAVVGPDDVLDGLDLQLPGSEALGRLAHAEALIASGDPEGMQLLRELSEDTLAAPFALEGMAEVAAHKKLWNTAYSSLSRMVALDPYRESPRCWMLLAHAARKLGRIEQAIAGFDRAIELGPESARSRSYRANLALRQGDFETALRLATELVDDDLGSRGGHQLRGEALFGLRRHDEAEQALANAVWLGAEGNVHWFRAKSLYACERLADAVDAMEQYVEQGTDDDHVERSVDVLTVWKRELRLATSEARPPAPSPRPSARRAP